MFHGGKQVSRQTDDVLDNCGRHMSAKVSWQESG